MRTSVMIFTVVLMSMVATPLLRAQSSGATKAPQGMTSVRSEPVRLLPTSSLDMNNFVISGTSTRSHRSPFVLNIHNNCFDTALRPVPHPLAPSSQIQIQFALKSSGGSFPVVVTYSADAVRAVPTITRPTAAAVTSGPGGTRAAQIGNLVRIEIPVSTSSTGPAPTLDSNFAFLQIAGPLTSPYVGYSGPLESLSHLYQSSDSYTADLEASFPGHANFCNGHN